MITNLLLGIGGCLVLTAPWVVILYNRYGFLTLGHVFIFGRSGQLNLSYYFHPTFYASAKLIIGPPAGLCCNWENPLYQLTQQPQYYGSLFSFSMVISEIRTVLYNFVVLLKLLHGFSFLSGTIILGLALHTLQKKDAFLSRLLLVMLVLPAGYLFLHIEDRFIWPLTFLILISGLALASRLLQWLPVQRPVRRLCWLFFFAGFLITPINNLKAWRHRGAGIFELANELKAKGIHGRFLTETYDQLQQVAYLTGSYYYTPIRADFQYDELLQAARQEQIDYYFYYYPNTQLLEAFKQTVFYKNALQEIPVKIPNLLLLKMK